jgi:hypothetical protein
MNEEGSSFGVPPNINLPSFILPGNALEKKDQQGVCHMVALPFTLKSNLKAKEQLWKLKSFTMQKYINLQKILSKKPKSFKVLKLYN